MKTKEPARSGHLFITGCVFRRVPLFLHREACEIFLRTLEAYRQKYAIKVHAFALMPDHYHLLIWFSPERSLTGFLRDFKSFAGKQIIEWLKDRELLRLLAHFRLGTDQTRRKDPRYCVFQYGNHVKRLSGSKMFWQKLEYIHLNPVLAGLASKPEGYLHSSARTYTEKGFSLVKIEFPE